MGGGNLPNEIVEAISISNAKSIGEQPAILSNLALAAQILNQNMQQQLMLAQQQAINQITLATTAKCIALITGGGKSGSGDPEAAIRALKELSDYAEQYLKRVSSAAPQPAPPAPGSEPAPSPGKPEGGGRRT